MIEKIGIACIIDSLILLYFFDTSLTVCIILGTFGWILLIIKHIYNCIMFEKRIL